MSALNLYHASNNGNLEKVRELLQNGVNPNAYKDGIWRSPLHFASSKGHSLVVRELLNAGANANSKAKGGMTPLIAAAMYGNIDVVKELIQRKVDLEQKDDYGKTALDWAKEKGHEAVVAELIETHPKYLLLFRAAEGNELEANRLLRICSDTEFCLSDGKTPLIIAAENGHLKVVESLLNNNANVRHVDQNSYSALIHAIKNNHTEIITELLQKGNDLLNLQDITGNTPLIEATQKNSIEIVTMLLEAGADRTIHNKEGYTALDFAKKSKHDAIISLLTSQRMHDERTQSAQNHSDELLPLEKLWMGTLDGSMTKKDVFEFLSDPNIDCFQQFIIAHNILLIAVRDKVVTLDNIRLFQEDPNYLAMNIYSPIQHFMHGLDDYKKMLCQNMLRQAKTVSFINNHHFFSIAISGETYREIQKISESIENVARDLQNIDNRVQSLEKWASKATEEIHKVCENNERIVRDISKLGNSLNNLHSVLRDTERKRFYAGIAGVVLSFIPVIGGALSTSASASAEILLGLNQEDLLENGTDVAKETINHFLSTDLSSFQSVRILTSERFIVSLDKPTKIQVVTAIENSEFGSVENFRKELFEAVKVLKDLKKISDIDEGVESELANRFRLIAMESIDSTAAIRDAAPELYHFCRLRLPNFDESEKEVRKNCSSIVIALHA